ncbi:transglutaminase-like domain-containing protein [Planctomycetota bacterium]|nr:transglutaminase-like domain-containing protein [Planctomycetota bacterium]
MKTKILTLLALVLMLQTSAIAEDTKPAQSELIQTHQYVITMMGSRIGWVKSFSGKAKLGDTEYNFDREQSFLSMTRSFDTSTFVMTETGEVWSTPSGSPVKRVSVSTDASKKKTIVVEYHADKAVITTTIDDGTPRAVTVEYGDKTVQDSDEVFAAMKKAGKWKAGLEHSYHTLDVGSESVVKESWKVIGESSQLLLDGTTAKGMKLIVTNSSGSQGTLIVDTEGEILFMEDISGITQEFIEKIPTPFKPEKVMIETVMKSNMPVADAHDLSELEVMFDWQHDDAAEDIVQILDTNTYHDVARLETGFAAKLKSQTLPKDFKLAYPLTEIPDDVKTYLRATPQCQSDDPVLAAKGKELAKDETDARKVANKIVAFVDSHIKPGSGASGNASAKQVYKEKKGDCTEFSALFVALARAADVPARNVSGIVYIYSSFSKQGIFGYHAWSEVWLGKWVPVDATVKEVGTSARYMMFEIDEPGHFHGSGRTGRCLRQRIKPEIVGYKKSTGKTWRKKDLPEFKYSKSDE